MRIKRMRPESRELLALGVFGRTSAGDRIEILLRHGRDVSPRASFARVAAALVVLTLFGVAGSIAPQWVAFAQDSARPSFQVASIKPFVGSTRVPAEFHLQPDGALTIIGYPLQNLIANAYGIREEQIIGRREWMNSARFSIDASAPGNPGKAEMMRMLQTLLEDKFGVRVHRETKELPVFTLTAAKGGLKLDQNEEGCAAFEFRTTSVPPTSPRLCGLICNESCFWRTDRTDMEGFTNALSGVIGRPVIDKTGFTGTFSLHLEWQNERPWGTQAFSAALERLGLQLTPSTGDVDFLVIDEVEDPYGN